MKKKRNNVNPTLAGAASETVKRFGSGIKEHIVINSGQDNETGTLLKRSLQDVAHSKVNPEFQDQNLKQQAGFAAELKEVARRRAEETISGKKAHSMRVDDVPGHVNDQLFDITCKVDKKGDPVPGASAQMKFVGSSPEAAVKKMLTRQYQKYHDNNVKILVPKEYYRGMKETLQQKITSLEKQLTRMREAGASSEAIEAKVNQLNNCKTLKRNLRESQVTNADAMEARKNPALSTAKDIAGLGHRAGVEQAKMGVAIGGSISLVRNFVAVCKDEKTKEDAALAIAKDTAGAAVVSYTTAAGGAIIKGTIQNSPSSTLRAVSKTNAPAYIAVATLETGKTLTSYFNGNIDTEQCLEELGEKGYSMVNSALYAAIGQAVIPIPIVGAMAGSMVGCILSSASYDVLQSSLLEAKLSEQERIRVEQECEEHIAMLQEYKAELERMIKEYMSEQTAFFNDVFSEMLNALRTGDTDQYIEQTNRILINSSKTPLFANQNEFDQLMESNKPIKM